MEGSNRRVFVSSTPGAFKTLTRRKKKAVVPGKKVSDIKRLIAADTEGLSHAIHVTTASISGKAGALELATPI